MSRNPYRPTPCVGRGGGASVVAVAFIFVFAWALAPGRISAQTDNSDISALKKEIDALKKSDAEKAQKIAELEGAVQEMKRREATSGSAADQALEAAIRDVGQESTANPSAYGGVAASGPGAVHLLDLSLSTTIVGGTSTAPNSELPNLKAGDHDPNRRGFRVPNTELSASGAVDPYFTAEAHIVYAIEPDTGETSVELEEAFITTTDLPWGLQVEAGQSLLEFGRINPKHPHQWDFIDQPVVISRMFGADGMRSQGVRLGWLIPVDWFAELHAGVYNGDGATMASFKSEESMIGGRPVADLDVRAFDDLAYLLRLDQNFELADEWTLNFGLSAVHGANASGRDGDTWIYGGDVFLKWQPVQNERGWPFVSLQSEIIKRDYNAAAFFDPQNPLDPADDISIARDTLDDWGVYVQLVWGFTPDWTVGARYEYASGSGADVDPSTGFAVDRSTDPFRDDRTRISALLTWSPTHFSKFRLQYDFDRADHLANDAHSVFLSLEVLIGVHPAHTY